MILDHEYVIRVTAKEKRLLELGLYVLIRDHGNKADVDTELANHLYDVLCGLRAGDKQS